MLPSPSRRAALLAATAVLAALVPLTVASAPAGASAGCLSEKAILGLTCDDEKPPVTANASGSQTAAGQVTVTATASYTDGDSDPIGFQCQLVGTAVWGPCTIGGLGAGSHTVAVRAVDTADLALTVPCDHVLCTTPEVPDYDATPESVTVNVTGGGGGGGGPVPPPPGPNGAPETQISGGPTDRVTPGSPVTLDRKITVTLLASEPATFNCALNARKVPCRAGTTVLKRLHPGPQVFVAQAVDHDGNFDATPASITFYVPTDLSAQQGTGWKNVASPRSYGHDVVTTTHRGAVLNLGKVSGVHELRLLAPAGPGLGTVAIRVGSGPWFKVSLTATTGQRLKAFEVRGADSKGLSGVIRIQALKIPAGGSVAVDALVAR